ncbi:helix-turn-helix transcriptional regulator [Amycolatopsis cihanbeyliensis]|uniref:HTH domain-containing protein n=1 Tax=Amycolatopsis cihanbeyliensis TaxID=1128664 RepID=A0A542DRM7_AMYCI|nr:transcriptional regulator [Amycolatopsis cihanbeyliensis]TQJ05759.1 HTH domain-containing protein [Amycolatopsis cihanbeyliensis]
MLDTAARLLRLLSLLQAHQQLSGTALADRLGVSNRTVRADIDRLRTLGYDIDATPGVSGGYRLGAGSALPPLLLDDNEALAVAIGLRTAAGSGVAEIGEHAHSAATKLERLLPARLRHRLATLSTVAETVPSQRDPIPADTLHTIAAVCRTCEQLRFDYRDHHREPSVRRVEPHRLVHVSGRWYLVAYDLDRDDWRSFRVDRIHPRTPTGPRFAPRELPGPDLPTFVTRGRMAALWNYRARVIVTAPAEAVAARIPSLWSVEPRTEETSLLDAGAPTPELLAAYLGALGFDFHINPDTAPGLANASATLAKRYAHAAERGESTQT